ncbi:MAG: hypothetical protein AAGI53_17840, partial [Planctomycetota bacterium]
MSTIPTPTAPPVQGPALPSPAADAGPRPKRWTREEYHRLGEQGFFDGRRVELINGEILEVSPQSHDHFWSIEGLRELLAE